MKKQLHLTVGLALATAAAHAQAGPASAIKPPAASAPIAKAQAAPKLDMPGPQLRFAKTKYDYGTVKQPAYISHTFKFKNVGDQPLLIASVSSASECTLVWPKKPVAPGEGGEVSVSFWPPLSYGQKPTVTTVAVESNSIGGSTTLSLTGYVLLNVGPIKQTPAEQAKHKFLPPKP